MCGIIGILGERPAAPLLLDCLRRLEYRGYDSAGVATLTNGHIGRRRAAGKIANLALQLERQPLEGTVGIGHTRWATHGRPSAINAHPIASELAAVVHNGIIENHQELRAELERDGHVFETETDTEAVVHLLTAQLQRQLPPQQAVAATLHRLEGAFALAIIFAGRHDLMIGARRGSPLAVGYGDDGSLYLGSDALALAPLTQRICYLEEGDWVVMTPGVAQVFDRQDQAVERVTIHSALGGALVDKGGYRHFMLKEIHEQPAVVARTLQSLAELREGHVALPALPLDWKTLPRLTLSACGTAFYAGLIAKYWFEQLARLPIEADIASEFRYREPPLPKGGAAIFVSQSGETIDTLAALRYARSQGQTILSVVNQPESAIARESDLVLPTLAGPEIGVASTKALTTQLMVLACLAIAAARARGRLDAAGERRLVSSLAELPGQIALLLEQSGPAVEAIVQELAEARDVLFLGRGSLFPVALEGALKLKEVSYIHAEGHAAGELKHGPIALVDEHVPVVVCAPSGPLFEKTASNVQEVLARGARVVLVSDAAGLAHFEGRAAHCLELPATDPFVAPILYSVAMQLLAYGTATQKGTDVDQPRNLAKSVTVE